MPDYHEAGTFYGSGESVVRVVVSGTHGSGKSTLISDFTMNHRAWRILPDPYEEVDLANDIPGAATFFEQLRSSALRLLEPQAAPVIAERGPLDFLAYLHASAELGRPGEHAAGFERGVALTRRAMEGVDLLVLLPLNLQDTIDIAADEDLELRAAMDQSLLELAEDLELTAGAEVVELVGSREERRASLETIVGRWERGAQHAARVTW